MSTKAALKAAKTALDAEDYDGAIKEAQNVLSTDGKNYFAKLFLARAYEKQGKYEDAASTYASAADSKPEDGQAWLGLCSVYEAQGSSKVDEYRDAAVKVAVLFEKSDDKHRCQSTVDKLIGFCKQHGTKKQYKRALEVLLPTGPVFEYLEGRIQPPSTTYTRIAEMTEEEEASKIKLEISNRRTRIGATVGQVTTDVKREVFAQSPLEGLYQEVINWSSDDEVRRQYEEKLLERAYATLIVLPTEKKSSKLDQVLTLAEGMVIIHYPFQLAWTLVLESRDLDDLRGLDVNILREYTTLFPESGLSKILQGWLSSELSPFPAAPHDEETDGEPPAPLSPEDRLLLFTEGLSVCEDSPFAHRLVGDFFLHLEEHGSAAETARSGLKALNSEAARLGMTMQNTKDALNSVLATSLIQLQAPRNHPEARRLFEDILQRKAKFTPALIGLGLIFEENESYQMAIDFLAQALQEDQGNVRVGTELAWCRALAGDYSEAQTDLEAYLPDLKAEDPRTRDLKAQVLHRTGICIWNLDTSKAARKDRNGAYSRFLAAIKTNVSFAPAYTSLGRYYSDYSKDKKRARQCFQKAFELSPAETDAAEALARSFADQGDWDIVEVIAQRVIDTGRARPPPGSKRKGLSWPYSSLGVVQMNKQDYSGAITSFLTALRISPDDYSSYVGLGESYHNSGRYNSALRTFHYALEPQDGVKLRVSGETWFARYMLANVHREVGEYEDAVTGLQGVLAERPGEFGVLVSLLQTYVEQAWRFVETGLFGQAVTSSCDAVATAVLIAKDHANAFNLWKAVGDACSIFSWVESGLTKLPREDLISLLQQDPDSSAYASLNDIDQITLDTINAMGDASTPQDASNFALLAYKRAIHSCSHDVHAQAVAWYNLGWAEHRTHTSSPAKAGKKLLKAAVRCFKRAIELEAGNAEFWNALGMVTTTLNPKVAQHSFVRSLHLNELNAKVWTNLGVLYLLQNDNELAHQSFGRAQSTDPGNAHAWVGEGLIALLLGDKKEALNHFTHAFEISDSSSLIAKKQYTQSAFDHLLATPSASNDLTALIQPNFALEQLHAQSPKLLQYNHLAALFFERVGNHTAALEALASLCEAAEADYEASESLAALARFAHAKVDLARNHLAARDFAAAAANAETALDLSFDAEESGLDAELRAKLRLSSHLTAGLAYHHLQKSSEAIAMFRTALQESKNDPDVIVSLVQMLWAHGGKEEKSVARDQLFECVEQHSEHIGAVTLLGSLAALEDDQDTIAAVKDDLLTLGTKDGITRTERNQIETLLPALAALDFDSNEDAALTAAQTAVMLGPEQPRAWSELAALSGEAHPASMALETAKGAVPPAGEMDAAELAKHFAGVGTAGDSQRATVLAPWLGAEGSTEK